MARQERELIVNLSGVSTRYAGTAESAAAQRHVVLGKQRRVHDWASSPCPDEFLEAVKDHHPQ